MLLKTPKVQKFLASLVLAEMKNQRIPQWKVAEEAGISDKHLSRLFSGESAGSLQVWDNLLRAVGVNIWPEVNPPAAQGVDMSSRRYRAEMVGPTNPRSIGLTHRTRLDLQAAKRQQRNGEHAVTQGS